MHRLIMCAVACLLLALVPTARAMSDGTLGEDWSTATSTFDAAIAESGHDEVRARPKFVDAARRFEAIASKDLSDHDRARAYYNAGVAHQLAGETPAALLALSRAELLHPALAGLAPRAAAARAMIRGERGALPVVPPSAGERILAIVWSVPSTVVWWTLLGSWTTLWAMVLVQMRFRHVHLGLGIVGAMLVCVSSCVWIWSVETRRRDAQQQAIVLAETAPRDQPDELIGRPAGSPLAPGTELRVLETRVGGDGRPWSRVVPLREQAADSETQLWTLDSALTRVWTPHPG